MRNLLIISALILGMAALTTEEVKAQREWQDVPPPPRPGTHPYPGGSTPWTWEPWQNPLNP